MNPITLKDIPFRDKNGRKQRIQFIHLEPELLALSKPSGIPVIPDHWNPEAPNIRDILNRQVPAASAQAEQSVWVVHRLDKDTTGVLLFARSADMHRSLNSLFESGDITKTYLAVTRGGPPDDEGVVDLPINRHPSRGGLMVIDHRGKPAITHYRVLERYNYFSLLELIPQTGRTHQIRVHMAALGCPLAVDPVYGNSERLDLSQIKRRYQKKDPWEETPALIQRLTLHAAALEFDHPQSGERLKIAAEAPKDFRALQKALKRWGETR